MQDAFRVGRMASTKGNIDRDARVWLQRTRKRLGIRITPYGFKLKVKKCAAWVLRRSCITAFFLTRSCTNCFAWVGGCGLGQSLVQDKTRRSLWHSGGESANYILTIQSFAVQIHIGFTSPLEFMETMSGTSEMTKFVSSLGIPSCLGPLAGIPDICFRFCHTSGCSGERLCGRCSKCLSGVCIGPAVVNSLL